MDDDSCIEYDVEHSKQLIQLVWDGNETAVRTLLFENHGYDVNASTVDGVTAFIYSLYHYLNGNKAITKLLLPYCNCFQTLSDAHGTVDQIANRQLYDFVKLLITHNADFLSENENNKLQLVELLLGNNELKLLWDFIEAGLYIHVITDNGENIYHLLAMYCADGTVDCCGLLLHNIDMHFINNDKNTPLMIASFLNNHSFIECCIGESGQNLDLQNGNGHTALHLCIIGFAAIIKKLCEAKSEKHLKQLCDYNYYTDFKCCVDRLLGAGIDVDTRDNSGKTALMLAVMTNDKVLVGKLLLCRADPWILDNEGRFAIQYFNFMDYTVDLACFALLYAQKGKEGKRVLNLPQKNGETIIQNMLNFSQLWNLDQCVLFIKFLIGCNISLQTLNSSLYTSYEYIPLEEFSSEERQKLREILYLSGAPFSEIITALSFEAEERAMQSSDHAGPRQAFAMYCNNLSLEKRCRRVIRQGYGLKIHDVAARLGIPHLSDFLLLNDCPEYGIPQSLDDDRFLHNQTNNDDVNYNLYDLDTLTDSKSYDHIHYLNEKSFYNFS